MKFPQSIKTRGKSWGQNFLIDANIANKIAVAARELSGVPAKCFEVGAGTGNLTSALLAQGFEVVAVEKDAQLVATLAPRFADMPVEVLHADVLQQDLPAGMRLCVGNLPYSITTDILIWFKNQRNKCKHALFMVQRELAERLVAPPSTRAYGRISVLMQLLFKMDMLFAVSANCFRPIPKVSSAVISLVALPSVFSSSIEERNFERFTHTLFHVGNKTLAKTAKMYGFYVDQELAERRVRTLTPDEIKSLFIKVNKDTQKTH